MSQRPLSALMSQVLIAFTIEFDNGFERRRAASRTPLPWFLMSLPMWSNFVRLLGDDAISLGERAHAAASAGEPIAANVGGLERWGYIALEPAGLSGAARTRGDKDFGSGRGLKNTSMVRLTDAGREAREIWAPLIGLVEGRWRTRFGEKAIDDLTRALSSLVGRFEQPMPRSLPLLTWTVGMRTAAEPPAEEAPPVGGAARNDLPALLSQALVAFTLEFERDSALSLALSANALRVLGKEATPVRDLPLLNLVSKEANAMALTFLQKHDLAIVEPDRAASKGKQVRLTGEGRKAKSRYEKTVAELETRWETTLGKPVVQRLRKSLERLFAAEANGRPLMSEGLVPDEAGWRLWKQYAPLTELSIDDPAQLPHYPMVLHRGGWPDGS